MDDAGRTDEETNLDRQEYMHPTLARAHDLAGDLDGLLSADPPRFDAALRNAEELVAVLRQLTGGHVDLADDGPGLRDGLLDLVRERGEVDVRDLAALVGRPLGTVGYHVRAMRDAGRVELDGHIVRRPPAA